MLIPSKCESVKPDFRDIPATHVCRDEIQEEPKLKCYQIGGAETTLIIVAIRRDNYLQDFNMVKIQSRPQTTKTR